MNLNIKIGGDIGECGQPESVEPEGFSNLKKVNNILVYCRVEFNKLYNYINPSQNVIQNKRRPNTLNEELLNPTILEIQDKNLYTINILNLEREQFNYWKENIIKENEIEPYLMKEEKEVSKFIVEVTREDIESNEEYNKN
ncbi:hypothetical protein H8356DRAFT_1437937 [Neocallimastix lanati (nom. inval.)]|nr:hypothetical protein H8356DRAFT_1437937 [Neocallimastix sp. JGI-2020a]